MRNLSIVEIANVAGATGCYTPTPPVCAPKKLKGNNGFGNGAFDGVPGKSGKTDTTR